MRPSLNVNLIRCFAENPNYRPHCPRCKGHTRMTKIQTLLWKCHFCRTICDERNGDATPVIALFPKKKVQAVPIAKIVLKKIVQYEDWK